MPLVGAHEPEIADFDKAFGQDMLQKSSDQIQRLRTARFSFPGLVVFIRERNRAILMKRQIPVIRHRRPEDVRRKILNHLPPVACRFAMHHPFYLPAPDFFRHLRIKFRMLFQSVLKQHFKPESQGRHMRQKLLVFEFDPVFAVFGQPDAGDNVMKMRMIKQFRGPGLQNAEEPDVSPDKTLVGGYILERLRRRLEEKGITNLLMRPEDFPECGRQRKRRKEIGNRQEPVELLFQPAFGFIPAAFRAMAVVA